MQELVNRAKELLESGEVARVLGWKAGDLPYNPEPAYFNTVEELKDFVYIGKLCFNFNTGCSVQTEFVNLSVGALFLLYNGQNMLFLPAFTPPLDTPVNEERMTVQLVDVILENDVYYISYRQFMFNTILKFI